jgi:hypothetical protein
MSARPLQAVPRRTRVNGRASALQTVRLSTVSIWLLYANCGMHRFIYVPTFVLALERDFWSRPADRDKLTASLVHAPVKVVVIPDATHFVHLDRPEHGQQLLLQEVAGFIRGDERMTRSRWERVRCYTPCMPKQHDSVKAGLNKFEIHPMRVSQHAPRPMKARRRLGSLAKTPHRLRECQARTLRNSPSRGRTEEPCQPRIVPESRP